MPFLDRDRILAIARRHGVTSVRVFGSFARGETTPNSDLDLLIEAGSQTTPFSPAA
jgi:predicted nucleotidyltransferase